ncbi:DUF1206 domain-containing protein [Nocardia sp. NPDC055049]
MSGIVHLFIGYIAIRLALGGGGGTADQSGAMAELAAKSGGPRALGRCRRVLADGVVAARRSSARQLLQTRLRQQEIRGRQSRQGLLPRGGLPRFRHLRIRIRPGRRQIQ